MKKMIWTLLLAFPLLFACQNGDQNNGAASRDETIKQQTPEITQPAPKQKPEKHYSIDSVQIRWTAYKTTAKIPVNGTFKKFTYSLNTQAASPAGILNEASVQIQTVSVFSGNDARDKILREAFFQMMMETNVIELRTSGWDGSHSALHTVIRMNNTEIPVTFAVKQKDGLLQGDADIDVIKQFKAGRALYHLHNMCEDKHTGKDGVSKTWTGVHLQFQVYYH